MSPFLLWLIGAVRALVEVAGLSLLAQGTVGLLAGSRRGDNPIYRLFQVVTRPVLLLLRRLLLGRVADRQLPAIAFFLLFWLWIALAYLRKILLAGE